MASIKVTLKSGVVKDFPHTGRAGGSYTKTVRYEGSWAIVRDEYDKETAFPMDTVDHIESTPERY